MSVSLEKLNHLWKRPDRIISKHRVLSERADQIFRISQHWDDPATRSIIKDISKIDYGCTEDEDIPSNDWELVKDKMREFYAKDTHGKLQNQTAQVDEIDEFLYIKGPNPNLRISSNTALDKTLAESRNTTRTQRNPESWFASYHFPFEIIRFFQCCHEVPIPADSDVLRSGNEYLRGRYRFVTKFIWITANRNKMVPILSLRSFYRLAPIFTKMRDKVNWDGGESDAGT